VARAQRRDQSAQATGLFVFGLQIFGTDEKTFPFLAKYPDLYTECGKLVHLFTNKSKYPHEQPVLQMICGLDMMTLDIAASSDGTCGGSIGSNRCDDTVGVGGGHRGRW